MDSVVTRNVILLVSGTGKTMLASALAVCTCHHQGRRIRVTILATLANELQEAQGNRELARVIARYARTELLVCDLCRDGDYADINLASAADDLISVRFLLLALSRVGQRRLGRAAHTGPTGLVSSRRHSIRACGSPAHAAPRGALLYPRRSRDELEGGFLGPLAYPDPKGESVKAG